MLFMPGHNPGNIINAGVFGADAVIIDLEDAVTCAEKDSARILTRNALLERDFGRVRIIIRVNGLDTPFWRDDLAAMVPCQPYAIMTPKTHSVGDVGEFSAAISEHERAGGQEAGKIRLIPLLESARGIEAAPGIARADPRVEALYLGAEDLALNLGARRTIQGEEILYCRSRLVLAARAAGITALDTPFLDITDNEGLRQDAERARNMGFGGKAAIYPLQVETINETFSPSKAEYAEAKEILDVVKAAAAKGKGVAIRNGKLLDGPLIAKAENTVKEYEAVIHGRMI
jgi:citrate lyase subunit beta/citryl-CoA lyase